MATRSLHPPWTALTRVKIYLEQTHSGITLIRIMRLKTIIALIFGLVFQLAHVLPGMAAAMTDCAPTAESCACCDGLDSCPCADEGEPVQNPLPLAPDSSQTLKAPLAKVTCTRVSLEAISGPQAIAPSVTATPLAGPWTGYTGVRLSVAFCSFVI